MTSWLENILGDKLPPELTGAIELKKVEMTEIPEPIIEHRIRHLIGLQVSKEEETETYVVVFRNALESYIFPLTKTGLESLNDLSSKVLENDKIVEEKK